MSQWRIKGTLPSLTKKTVCIVCVMFELRIYVIRYEQCIDRWIVAQLILARHLGPIRFEIQLVVHFIYCPVILNNFVTYTGTTAQRWIQYIDDRTCSDDDWRRSRPYAEWTQGRYSLRKRSQANWKTCHLVRRSRTHHMFNQMGLRVEAMHITEVVLRSGP